MFKSGQYLSLLLAISLYFIIRIPSALATGAIKINPINQPTVTANAGEIGRSITTTSSPAAIELAKYLTQINAKIYTAYTCPHCYQQKQLFGQEAFSLINNIECHPRGRNAQPQVCQSAGIRAVPTWEINGKFYRGTQSLEKLADISEYQGSLDFSVD